MAAGIRGVRKTYTFTVIYSNKKYQVLIGVDSELKQSSHPSKNTSMPSKGSSHNCLSQGPRCGHRFYFSVIDTFKFYVVISWNGKSLTLDGKADETQTLASVFTGWASAYMAKRYIGGQQPVNFLAINTLGRTTVFIRYFIHNSFSNHVSSIEM